MNEYPKSKYAWSHDRVKQLLHCVAIHQEQEKQLSPEWIDSAAKLGIATADAVAITVPTIRVIEDATAPKDEAAATTVSSGSAADVQAIADEAAASVRDTAGAA